MIRHLLVAAAFACSADALGAQTSPLIELTDHAAMGYDLSAAYPDGLGPFTNEIVAGDDAIAVELRYNVPVEVRLIGATATGQLSLRQASGATTTVRLFCSWADLDLPLNQRTFTQFPCYASGTAGPAAPAAGLTKRVLLRVTAVTIATPQGTAAAGHYSGTAYFRVDAR